MKLLTALLVLCFTGSLALDAEVVSVTGLTNCRGTPCISPATSKTVTVVVKNLGSSSWPAGATATYVGESSHEWTIGDFTLAGNAAIAQGQQGSFTGSIESPAAVGLHGLEFRILMGGTVYANFSATVEVSCSDGIFCNGPERYVNGQCVNSSNPCDDKNNCTTDLCNENYGTCSYIRQTEDIHCTECNIASRCEPDCDGKECGDDGCGAPCDDCDTGFACYENFTCGILTELGSCRNPIIIWTPDSEGPLLSTFEFAGDNSLGFSEVVPSCNDHTRANEIIYYFEIPAGSDVGIDARVYGIDSVLDLRKSSCYNKTASVGCSDDATPPGDFGSRIAAVLSPGSYYLIVDAYAASEVGPFDLSVRFIDNCYPLCDGRYCGSDSCGGECDSCEAEDYCDTDTYRCRPTVCIPDCDGKDCGEDGCGGQCGICSNNSLCVRADFKCRSFGDCNHHQPNCTGCEANQYCGSDCQCWDLDEHVPDLVIDREELSNHIVFEVKHFGAESCAWSEECIGELGNRRLMRFNVLVVNQGFVALEPPNPSTRPDLFEWSPCHGHYHFSGFADYELLDINTMERVVEGRKQAYCMLDSSQSLLAPHIPCNSNHDCDNQGILPGWGDLYSNDLDCQWVDVTGVPPGDYYLRVFTNKFRTFHEASFENNVEIVTINIPDPCAGVLCEPLDTPCRENICQFNVTHTYCVEAQSPDGTECSGGMCSAGECGEGKVSEATSYNIKIVSFVVLLEALIALLL